MINTSMDLQSRKLSVISYLVQIQDEALFAKIENYIFKKKPEEKNLHFAPFTREEFIRRIERSEQDLKNGKFKTQDDLEEIGKYW